MRASGVLMPVSSLPSRYGIGCFSKEAYEFVDCLERAGQSKWQVLPLGPTGYGDSPYQPFSTFAGNPYFIDLDTLVEEGLLYKEECERLQCGGDPRFVDYERIYFSRNEILRKAYERFSADEKFHAFCKKEQEWLEPYCLFRAIKDSQNGALWTTWPEELRKSGSKEVQNKKKELEKEMQITIFDRTNKGIHVSREGEIFLGYARQVLEQAALIEEKYKHKSGGKQEFCISTQHYSFAVNAFVDLIKEYGSENYDFSLRETQTYEIIDDVARMKSEIGILYLNEFNASVLEKIMKANDLKFTELFVARPHIFICDKNPLAQKDQVTMEDLKDYPYLSFEQGEHNSFYYSEEMFSTEVRSKNIRVRDRATLFNLLIGLNGYTISSGVIDKELNGENIIAVPLAEEGEMHIGYVTHKKTKPSRLGAIYLEALKRHAQ